MMNLEHHHILCLPPDLNLILPNMVFTLDLLLISETKWKWKTFGSLHGRLPACLTELWKTSNDVIKDSNKLAVLRALPTESKQLHVA